MVSIGEIGVKRFGFMMISVLLTFTVFGADAPTRAADKDAGGGAYHRLTEDWACATIRLYSNVQSAAAAEVRDWGENWRIAEVQKALRSLPDDSTCVSASELEAIKTRVNGQVIADLREQEFLRLLWLRAKLYQTDYDPRYPGSSLLPATIKSMQALGWSDKQILGAVSGNNAQESRILTTTLVESVLQEIKSEQEPYRDPTPEELRQKLPATLDAASKAAEGAAKAAQHAGSPLRIVPPPSPASQ